jgi:hypothetical protein
VGTSRGGGGGVPAASSAPLVASAGGVLAQAEEIADAVLAHAEVVRLAAPPSAVVPQGLCRQDGLGTHERHGAARYTTRATLALEVLCARLRRRRPGIGRGRGGTGGDRGGSREPTPSTTTRPRPCDVCVRAGSRWCVS